jgi:hypothetical protein
MARTTYKREKDVKAEVRKIFDAYPDWFHWTTGSNGFNSNGAPDRCGLHISGVFLGVEVKFGYNKPSELQKAFLETINAQNSFGFVVNETTIEAFRQWMEMFDASAKLVSHKKPIPDEYGSAMLEAIRLMTEPLMEHKAHKIKNA